VSDRPAPEAPLDVLAVGAHPDDVEISCGGTLALATTQGYSVGILDLTRGELSTNGTPEIRAAEGVEAARALGVSGRWNAGLPDGGINSHDDGQTRQIAGWIRALRPSIVLVHFPRDRHPDHVEASLLLDRAGYLAGLRRYAAEGESFRPSARYHYASRVGFAPSFVVDVTEAWERKRVAILAHRSQVLREAAGARETALNDPSFIGRIEARAMHYGGMIGVRFGEPFHSEIPMGVQDLSGLIRGARPHPSAFTG
jgi:bacillithiol biosynthesis deacetylase BshB1